MPVAKGGQRLVLAALFLLAISCSAVRAADGGVPIAAPDGHGPVERTSAEHGARQTCGAFYRLDDVTELNDEIKRCLIASEAEKSKP